MDEVHYLADRFRGARLGGGHHPPSTTRCGWSPSRRRCPNAEEFGDWLQAVRGDTEVIVSEERPGSAGAAHPDAHAAARPVRLVAGRPRRTASTPNSSSWLGRADGRARSARARDRGGGRVTTPSGSRRLDNARMERHEVIRAAGTSKNLLPAIAFIFSRVGCDAAVSQVPARGHAADHQRRSATRSARSWRSAAASCATRTSQYSATGNWLEGSSAASHPITRGCCPPSRKSSRSCSSRSLLKVVFATETLALGINMPAAIRRARAGSRSTTARRRCPSRRGSTRSSPAEPDVAASMSRATPSSSGWTAWTRRRSHRSHPAAPTPLNLELHAHLQHGREPDRAVRADRTPRDPRVVASPSSKPIARWWTSPAGCDRRRIRSPATRSR